MGARRTRRLGFFLCRPRNGARGPRLPPRPRNAAAVKAYDARAWLSPSRVMAYSLNDPYRRYRWVLRANALTVGIGFGLLLLLRPQLLDALWGWAAPPDHWALRLSGAGLAGMGGAFLEISGRPAITRWASLTVMLCNGLLAGLLFAAYFTGGLAPAPVAGRFLLFLLFLANLSCLVLPWAYLRDDLKP